MKPENTTLGRYLMFAPASQVCARYRIYGIINNILYNQQGILMNTKICMTYPCSECAMYRYSPEYINFSKEGD